MISPPSAGPAPLAPGATTAGLARLPQVAADLKGLSRLGVEAVLGVTSLVEAVHRGILTGRSGPADAAQDRPAPGLTGQVYRGVRGTTRLAGHGLDALIGLASLAGRTAARGAPGPAAPLPPMPQREAALAVLNGLWGDHLAATDNPLAIPMALRVGGRALPLDGQPWAAQLPQASPRVLLLVHGLCMNDLQFQRGGHDHGQALQQAAGWTPVYLHYNTGLHISDNGRALARLLGELLSRWPVPVQQLAIVGHSMGGLVARSACHQAAGGLADPDLSAPAATNANPANPANPAAHRAAGQPALRQPWLDHLHSLVCLGSPHHGAPLERGVHLLDRLLGVSPLVAPLARLGRSRSAGITDLRWGSLQAADWQGRPPHDQPHDDRRATPLPDGVATCLVAATTAASTATRAGGLHSATLGDGLVPLHSALGQHARSDLALAVPAEHQRVVTGANHWDLLNHPQVAQALQRWLV